MVDHEDDEGEDTAASLNTKVVDSADFESDLKPTSFNEDDHGWSLEIVDFTHQVKPTLVEITDLVSCTKEF